MATPDLYLQGAKLVKNGAADFSVFTGLKLKNDLTASSVGLTGNSTEHDDNAASVKFVRDYVNLLDVAVDSRADAFDIKHSSHETAITALESKATVFNTRLGGHDTTLTDHGGRLTTAESKLTVILGGATDILDSFGEAKAAIDALGSSASGSLLTTFGDVQTQLNDLYKYFNQTRTSIAAYKSDPNHPYYEHQQLLVAMYVPGAANSATNLNIATYPAYNSQSVSTGTSSTRTIQIVTGG